MPLLDLLLAGIIGLLLRQALIFLVLLLLQPLTFLVLLGELLFPLLLVFLIRLLVSTVGSRRPFGGRQIARMHRIRSRAIFGTIIGLRTVVGLIIAVISWRFVVAARFSGPYYVATFEVGR